MYEEDSQGCLCSEEETAPLKEFKELPCAHRNISKQCETQEQTQEVGSEEQV